MSAAGFTWVYMVIAGMGLLAVGPLLAELMTETPEEAASRELAEETGYRAREMRPLGRFFPSPGMASYSVHVFVAETVERGDPMPDPEELIDVVLLGWEEVLRLVRMQGPVDGTLAYAVLRYGLEA